MSEKIQEASIEASTENISASKEFDVLPMYSERYGENHEFAGWIKIPGTKIDYPVMKTEEDNKYKLDSLWA